MSLDYPHYPDWLKVRNGKRDVRSYAGGYRVAHPLPPTDPITRRLVIGGGTKDPGIMDRHRRLLRPWKAATGPGSYAEHDAMKRAKMAARAAT